MIVSAPCCCEPVQECGCASGRAPDAWDVTFSGVISGTFPCEDCSAWNATFRLENREDTSSESDCTDDGAGTQWTWRSTTGCRWRWLKSGQRCLSDIHLSIGANAFYSHYRCNTGQDEVEFLNDGITVRIAIEQEQIGIPPSLIVDRTIWYHLYFYAPLGALGANCEDSQVLPSFYGVRWDAVAASANPDDLYTACHFAIDS